jgi:hypothetical protein
VTITGTVRPQLESLEDRTMPSSLVGAVPAAFQGLNVAVSRIQPGDPSRIVSPVFALNYGQASTTTLPAQAGLSHAARAPFQQHGGSVQVTVNGATQTLTVPPGFGVSSVSVNGNNVTLNGKELGLPLSLTYTGGNLTLIDGVPEFDVLLFLGLLSGV